MTTEITRPETEALINSRLRRGGFNDAENIILQALKSSEPAHRAVTDRAAAIERLFGKANNLFA